MPPTRTKTTTKPARELGLDDLRYDVEVHGSIGTTSSTGTTRYVGTLLLIEGPTSLRNADVAHAYAEYVTLYLAAGPRDVMRVIAPADREVVVDRSPTPTPTHFGA